MATVAFDGGEKLITITTAPDASGVVEVDVQKDLYSEAKRQWLTDSELQKYPFPFRTIGGDPLSPTLAAGAYFFLDNAAGWRIQPYEADHEAVFVGNLYRENVYQPLFISPPGGHTIALRLETSSLTQVVDSSGGTSDVNVVSVGGISVTGPDDLKADVSDLAQQATMQSVYDFFYGRWFRTGSQLIIFKPDNVTELARFELYNNGVLVADADEVVTERKRL